MQRFFRMTATAEVTAMAALVLSYIWIWQETFPGDFLVVTVLYFGIGAVGHLMRGESLRHIGFRFDNLQPAARNVALIMAIGIGLALAVGTALDAWHFPHWTHAAVGIPAAIAWGTIQQYGLLCVFYRRLVEALGNSRAATAIAAILFAVFHLPNGFLMAVTLAAGAFACVLYQRVPNVPVIGIAHGTISFSLYYALPVSVHGALRVGPGYFAMN